jgi:hypothetical protein
MRYSFRLWGAVPLAIPLGLSSAGVESRRSACVTPQWFSSRKRATSLCICSWFRSRSPSVTPGLWAAPTPDGFVWPTPIGLLIPSVIRGHTLPIDLPTFALRLPVIHSSTKRTGKGFGL